MTELFLKNGQIVTANKIINGSLVINNGTIIDIIEGDFPMQFGNVVDLNNMVVLAGVVDGHVHFNEPGRTEWEGYEAGSKAAAAGGTTTIFEMPLNATPPTISKDLLQKKRSEVENKSVVDYGQWGGLVNNNLANLQAMHEEGVVAFKAFTSDSGVDFERIDDDVLYAGLELSKAFKTIIGLHAENEFVTKLLAERLITAGRIDRAAWYESRPSETEMEAIHRACYWADVTGGNLHILHVSIAEGVQHISEFKEKGTHVTTESCPHYLYFDHKDFEDIGPAAKCAPPIRSRENVEALWEMVFNGQVDVINSDHSPCEWKDKEKGMENIWKAWGGITGIQMLLPVLLSEGVNKRGLPLTTLTKLISANPARIYGVYPRKGVIALGADADLVVVDLDQKWTLSSDQLFSRNQHSAYVGRTFKGKVLKTFVRGKLVYDKGKILPLPGYGQLVRREAPYNYY